jgi:hypothetical protein
LLVAPEGLQVVTSPLPGFHDLIGPTETISRRSLSLWPVPSGSMGTTMYDGSWELLDVKVGDFLAYQEVYSLRWCAP